jgi:hypothetical protein
VVEDDLITAAGTAPSEDVPGLVHALTLLTGDPRDKITWTIAEVQELQRLADEPPQHPLAAIGPPSPDPDGGQVERAQTDGMAMEEVAPSLTGHRDPDDEPEEPDSVSTWPHRPQPLRDRHSELDRHPEPERDDLGLDIDF